MDPMNQSSLASMAPFEKGECVCLSACLPLTGAVTAEVSQGTGAPTNSCSPRQMRRESSNSYALPRHRAVIFHPRLTQFTELFP